MYPRPSCSSSFSWFPFLLSPHSKAISSFANFTFLSFPFHRNNFPSLHNPLISLFHLPTVSAFDVFQCTFSLSIMLCFEDGCRCTAYPFVASLSHGLPNAPITTRHPLLYTSSFLPGFLYCCSSLPFLCYAPTSCSFHSTVHLPCSPKAIINSSG